MKLSKEELYKLTLLVDGPPLVAYVVKDLIPEYPEEYSEDEEESLIGMYVCLRNNPRRKLCMFAILPNSPQFSNMELGKLYTLKELIGKERVGL